jgi:hypothetical protein
VTIEYRPARAVTILRETKSTPIWQAELLAQSVCVESAHPHPVGSHLKKAAIGVLLLMMPL